jgi:NSS family neurotransmitter:Na+ symporter
MPQKSKERGRENWGSRLGVILAVSGSAVGLGNFLRFPVKAASNGGGAFMIPYFLAFLLVGIPLAWIEWTLGRYGGKHSHGSAPGIYHRVTGGRQWAKYLGAISIFVPLVISFYYVYVETWTLSFSLFSLTGQIPEAAASGNMTAFFNGFLGIEKNQFFSGPWTAVALFVLVFVLNYSIIYRGVTKGIEKFNKVAMPILLICGVVLAIRVLTLGTPDPVNHPEWNVSSGLGFMWNPIWADLLKARVWIEAAGQIFFTLSVGMGAVLAYASYLHHRDDVVLSSLTACSANEFCEVILGGSVGLVAAAIFYGAAQAQSIGQSGAFSLGFITMPMIFSHMGGGTVMGFLWFFLLFLAGITSSVSLLQPAVAFLEDELGLNRQSAVTLLGTVGFCVTLFVVLTLRFGTLDEMDFWGGTVLPVVSATIEVILFAYFLGIRKGFEEMHRGADMNVPKLYRVIIRYITPAYLIAILAVWGYQEWISVVFMKNISDPMQFRFVLITRILLLVLFGALIVFIAKAGRRGRFPALKGKGL